LSSELESLSESIEAGRPTSFLVALTWEDLGSSTATPSSPPLRLLGGVALDGDVASSGASVLGPLLGTAGNVTSSRLTNGFTTGFAVGSACWKAGVMGCWLEVGLEVGLGVGLEPGLGVGLEAGLPGTCPRPRFLTTRVGFSPAAMA